MKRAPLTGIGQWALWSPINGLVFGSIRNTPSQAIRAVWDAKAWPRMYREGWRIVRVQVDAAYFHSTKPTMQKVPR